MRGLLLLAATSWALTARAGDRTPLTVAAAANLKPAVSELARAFGEERPDAEVRVTFGASGAFYAQLLSGAPYDLFLSADREYPAKLVAAGRATEEVVYALGRLAVWIASPAPDAGADPLAALARPSIRRVAIANPRVAPYGRAAESLLRAAGRYGAVSPKLVLGESVGQAAQLAHAGAVDAAILPVSLAQDPALAAAGRTFPVPDALQPRLEQAAVLIRGAPAAELARAFLAFVRSPAGRAILARHGYGLP